jgi:cyclopropane fatty-acyl-phospholipid synthase-like methyltransferase
MMRFIRNLKNKTFDRVFPNWAYEHKKFSWQKKWSESQYAPNWRTTDVPAEVEEIVQSNWFPPGSTVLDIGCGSGEIAAWLSKNNYRVLGIDYSSSAIELANQQFSGGDEDLEFRTVDICQDHGLNLQFQALIDRGCLHGIPEAFADAYVQNVSSLAERGARFLLLFATNKGKRKSQEEEDQQRDVGAKYIEQLFEATFEILSISPTLFFRGNTDPATGIAVKMVRLS